MQPLAWSQQAQPRSIQIVVLSGQDAINNVDKRVVTEPVVEVRDESGTPISGAQVEFRTPATGPSATFYGATRVVTVNSDEKGRARADGMTPNTDLGPFAIQVTATHGSLQAETAITQTNALAEGASGKKRRIGWRLWTAIGAGVVIGIIAAVKRGDDSGPTATPAAATIGSSNLATRR